MIEGWTRRDKSVHLLFGGWYASALEHYYKYRAEGKTSDEALEEVVREALIETYEVELSDQHGNSTWVLGSNWHNIMIEHNNPDGPSFVITGGRPWTSDHPAKTRENLIRSIIWYVDQFEDEDIEVIHLDNGKPAVELSFKFELDDFVLCGHLDRLVTYAGETYVMDQKTSGSTITSRYFDNFNPDTQMSMYTLAGQVVFGALVKGVIIDAAQIAVGFTRFVRGFTFRQKAELDEFIEDTRANIAAAHRCADAGYYPKNTASCGNYGGCEFRGVCSKSPAVREQFLKAEFVKGERWNPLAVR